MANVSRSVSNANAAAKKRPGVAEARMSALDQDFGGQTIVAMATRAGLSPHAAPG